MKRVENSRMLMRRWSPRRKPDRDLRFLTLDRQLRWNLSPPVSYQSFDEPIMCNKAINSCHTILKLTVKLIEWLVSRMSQFNHHPWSPHVTVLSCWKGNQSSLTHNAPFCAALLQVDRSRDHVWFLCIKLLSSWRPDNRTIVVVLSSMTLSSQSITQRLILVHNL